MNRVGSDPSVDVQRQRDLATIGLAIDHAGREDVHGTRARAAPAGLQAGG